MLDLIKTMKRKHLSREEEGGYIQYNVVPLKLPHFCLILFMVGSLSLALWPRNIRLFSLAGRCDSLNNPI